MTGTESKHIEIDVTRTDVDGDAPADSLYRGQSLVRLLFTVPQFKYTTYWLIYLFLGNWIDLRCMPVNVPERYLGFIWTVIVTPGGKYSLRTKPLPEAASKISVEAYA